MRKKPLAIKFFEATEDDYFDLKVSGGGFEPFAAVDKLFKDSLVEDVTWVSRYFEQSFKKWEGVPCVAKVDLLDGAVAKSYRPVKVFNHHTCPITGGGGLGRIYVSVTPKGLVRLAEKIRNERTDESHLSTIKTISPYTAQDAIRGLAVSEVTPLKLRVFNHGNRLQDAAVDKALTSLTRAMSDVQVEAGDYGPARIMRLSGLSSSQIAEIASFPGTCRISTFQQCRLVQISHRVLGTMSSHTLLPPEGDEDYPVVLMIDSGTDPFNKHLQAWVVDRWDYVPRSQQNNLHGSFVGGLLAGARRLNHDDEDFPSCKTRIIDVAAIDNTDCISDFDLVTVIRHAVKKYPQAKVVNLSVSLPEDPCQSEEFSDIAAALDDISRKHGVRFAIPTGNATQSSGWPRDKKPQEDDSFRVLQPADSVFSVTTGSIAHLETASTCVRKSEPSPFTRGGPAAAYWPSPQLVHYGGNTDNAGSFMQTGVISLDGMGNLAEFVGTSFANPLTATLWANAEHQLTTDGTHQSCLSRALLYHSALCKQIPTLDRWNYCGLGKPPDIEDVLHCEQSAGTLVIHASIAGGTRFSKPFAIPSCLMTDGKIGCEILMTLLYEPPTEQGRGIEYCRLNIDACLGVTRAKKDKKTGEFKDGFDTEIPTYPKMKAEGHEKHLIEEGFKWSPLKVYYRRLSRMNASLEWELRFEITKRANFQMTERQNAVLIITIRDPNGVANVYDEMVQELNRAGWSLNDLQLKSQVRQRNLPR